MIQTVTVHVMIKDVLDNAKDGPKVGERFVFRPAGRLGRHKLEFVSAP